MTLKFGTYIQDEFSKTNKLINFLQKTYDKRHEMSVAKQMLLQNDNKFYKEVIVKNS